MFSFPIMAVRRIIARGQEDAAAHGGFRNPHYGMRPGENEQAGFWLVGDQGVYIMSNGKLADGQKPLFFHSTECHPTRNPNWWEYKRRHFGGDDGIEFIDADLVVPSFNRNLAASLLGIQLTEHDISFLLITR